jgi:hypothetical protein
LRLVAQSFARTEHSNNHHGLPTLVAVFYSAAPAFSGQNCSHIAFPENKYSNR